MPTNVSGPCGSSAIIVANVITEPPSVLASLSRPGADWSTPERACGSGADEASGARAGRLAVDERDLAGADSGFVAIDVLHEATASRREVVHDLGLVDGERVEVDEVDVGAQPVEERTAIAEAVDLGRP